MIIERPDARGLTFLRDRLGDRFQCGVLFHTGPLTARLGERVWAVPVAALWDEVSRAKDSLEDDRYEVSEWAAPDNFQAASVGMVLRDPNHLKVLVFKV